MRDIIRKTTTAANDLVDAFNWAYKRLDSPGRNLETQKLVGNTAEVSLDIKPGRIGQVLVVLGGTLQAYSAKANNDKQAFPKGTKVRITGMGNHVLFIDSYTESTEVLLTPEK
jgi:membrane protein implicated in regulation of membrane protease activity